MPHSSRKAARQLSVPCTPDESARLADIYETVINVLAGLLPWSTLPGQFRTPFEPTSAQAERTVRDLSGREVRKSHAFVNAILCMDGGER